MAGPTAAGKSTVGRSLAAATDRRFIEGDDHHPAENVARMSSGRPLTDAHRRPWLDALVAELAAAGPAVLSCSALRRAHRDHLRTAGPLRIVMLVPDPDEARRRAAARRGHFMPADLVESQYSTLEQPGPDEPDTLVLERGDLDVTDTVDRVLRWLG